METTANRVQEISKLVSKLPPAEQDDLLKALRKRVLLAKAEQLSGSVKPNTISMQEIVEEVRLVRKERSGRE
jgi:hypothetical protein